MSCVLSIDLLIWCSIHICTTFEIRNFRNFKRQCKVGKKAKIGEINFSNLFYSLYFAQNGVYSWSYTQMIATWCPLWKALIGW